MNSTYRRRLWEPPIPEDLAGTGTDLWLCCKGSEFLTPEGESVSPCSSLLPEASLSNHPILPLPSNSLLFLFSSILLQDFSSQAQTHEPKLCSFTPSHSYRANKYSKNKAILRTDIFGVWGSTFLFYQFD